MNNPLNSKLSQNLGLLLARVPLGLYLLLDGYGIIQHGLRPFVITNYFSTIRFMSGNTAAILLCAFPFVEVAAGAFIALGIFSRVGGFLGALALLLVMLAFNGLRGIGNAPFNPSIILFGIALFLCAAGAGSISLDRALWGRRRRRV